MLKGIIKLKEIVKSPLNKDLEIHLRQADPESYRAVLKEIKIKEIHNIIIDTKSNNMQHFLKGVSHLIFTYPPFIYLCFSFFLFFLSRYYNYK